MLPQYFTVRIVEFEAMAMTLIHLFLLVHRSRHRSLFELTRVETQSHRAPHVTDPPLFRQEVDHRVWRIPIKFRGVRIL